MLLRFERRWACCEVGEEEEEEEEGRRRVCWVKYG